MTKTTAKRSTTKAKANRRITKAKANRRITKAATSKTSVTKTSSPASDDLGLLVLGFDEQQKPCGARFVDAKPDLVAKAAQLMGLKVYKTSSPDVAEVAKKLPVGQLYATGRAFVPNIRQALYSDVIVALAAEPQQAAIGPDDDKASTPVAHGLPRNWDEIAPGHLVIAQESLANGWWEAIVLDRKDDMLTLRFRDFPRLPKFFRHRSAVALMSPASDQA
jgi:hypothetical protein